MVLGYTYLLMDVVSIQMKVCVFQDAITSFLKPCGQNCIQEVFQLRSDQGFITIENDLFT